MSGLHFGPGFAPGVGPQSQPGFAPGVGPQFGPPAATRSEWEVVAVPRAWHDAYPRPWRPRLRLFWDIFTVVLVVMVLGSALISGLSVVNGLLFPGVDATLTAFGIAVIFVLVAWFLVSRTILYRGTPLRLALAALAWGATGAVTLGAYTSSAHLSELAVGWGTPQIAWSLAGAWPEETAKAFGVVLLLFAGRTWWNRPWHGMVAGVLIGIGFEAFENALYAVTLAASNPRSDLDGVLEIWLARIIAGPLLHALCTGLVGYGIGMALLGGGLSTGRRIAWGVGGWVAGFLVHALWNLTPDWEQDSDVAVIIRMALVWVVAAAVVLTVWVRSTREARRAAAEGRYPVVTIYRQRQVIVRQPLPPAAFRGPGAGWGRP